MNESTVVDLSVTIASYNTKDYLHECLNSIYSSVESVSFEVIVVDNASHDGSPEMVRGEFPTVNLICNADNVGVAVATNQGIEASTGRYFITMNSDTVVQPGALDRLVEFMDAHPDVGAATARLVLPDGREHPPACGNQPSFRSDMLSALSAVSSRIRDMLPAVRFGKPIDYRETQEVNCVLWGTAMIVRRKVIDTVGGQDPRFFVYGEDTDWSMRIARAGWKQYTVGDAVIVHYGGQSTKQASIRMFAQLYKSRCRRTQKHNGLAAGLALRATIASLSLIKILKRAILYLLRPAARAEVGAEIARLWAVVRAVVTY